MRKVRLGRTNLQVTRWALGGIPLSTIMGGTTPETVTQIIHAALDRGINFIDTSRVYMDSETNIGEALAGRSDQCIIASKSFSRSRDDVLTDLEESLRQLQRDRIEIYQVHALKPEEVSGFMGPGGGMEGFTKARHDGLIDYIGLTSHHIDVLVELAGTGEFDTLMFPFNIIERTPEMELIPLSRSLDIGTLVMKPVAGGAIRNIEKALRFFNGYQVDCILNGVSNTAELEENICWAEAENPLSGEELRAFEEEVAPLGRNFCRRCSYCMPCPNDIIIPEMIHVFWQAVYGRDVAGLSPERQETGKSLVMWLQACEECGLCEKKCPYDLPTIKRKQDIIDMFSPLADSP